MITAKDDKIMKLKQKLADFKDKTASYKSDSARELKAMEARYAEMVEVKDAEIKTLQDLVSLSERKAFSDSVSEQKSLADIMIEKLNGVCQDKASLKEASQKIAQLESELNDALYKASSLQVQLTLEKIKLKVAKKAKLDYEDEEFQKLTEFDLPLRLADNDVKLIDNRGGSDFDG